jgi:hypothetical protein
MTYSLYDIWGKRTITDTERFIFEIPADDVVFIRYKGPLDRTRARQGPPGSLSPARDRTRRTALRGRHLLPPDR